jgi:hypothetical protein
VGKCCNDFLVENLISLEKAHIVDYIVGQAIKLCNEYSHIRILLCGQFVKIKRNILFS